MDFGREDRERVIANARKAAGLTGLVKHRAKVPGKPVVYRRGLCDGLRGARSVASLRDQASRADLRSRIMAT